MPSIVMKKMERNGQEFKVYFDLKTSYGSFPFETTVPDAGSPSETEKQALLEMKEVFQQVLAELETRLSQA